MKVEVSKKWCMNIAKAEDGQSVDAGPTAAPRKARPVRIEAGGYVECEPHEATHLTLRIPGPTGLLTLPVVQGNTTRAGTGAWTWNGSTEAPTLRPSVLTQYDGADRQWRCHSWINDGAAQFLDDCSHDMRGQTVPLLAVDESEAHNDHPLRHYDRTCPACVADDRPALAEYAEKLAARRAEAARKPKAG